VSTFKNYTYIFYDLETTGQNPCFDQVIRFAAKETDHNLNIINEHNISIKLRNDVIPHPKALLVNRLNINQLSEGLVEYEAFCKIHKIMNKPNTINIGYNSLSFDDKFLRFGFYRNLLDPYTHQYGNKFRADLYNMIFMYYLYKNDISITWPIINNRLSLRLEQINIINNLYDGMSHDAEVDVYVTIELAKQLKNIDDKMWDYLVSCFMTDSDKKHFSKLTVITDINNFEYKTGIFISSKNGLTSNYCAPVIVLCPAKENNELKNKKIRLLRLDNYNFEDFNVNNFSQKIEKGIITKTFGEPNFIIPFSDRYSTALNEHIIGMAKNNLSWIKHHPEAIKKLITEKQNKNFEDIIPIDLDASLYQNTDKGGGWFQKHEQVSRDTFHNHSISKKEFFLQELQHKPEQARIKNLGFRVMGRNYFDSLSSKGQNEYDKYLNSIFHKNPTTGFGKDLRVNPNLVLKETKELLNNKDLLSDDRVILNQLFELISLKIRKQQDLGF
tara:strand:+ start:6506 stop:8002 length:1497 start_codon:yes stop_codon:yes gene_type:complete